MADAVAAAMRPVDRHPFAERPAEQGVDRHAERLRLDIEAGVLDRRDRLMGETAPGETRRREQTFAQPADRARIHPDRHPGEVPDQRRDRGAGEPFIIFGPADDAFVGGHLHVGADAIAAVTVQGFDVCDLHVWSLSLAASAQNYRR